MNKKEIYEICDTNYGVELEELSLQELYELEGQIKNLQHILETEGAN